MDQAITLVLLRKRVFTKSPVRENRTPGSVRGLSGNWQSYRDQLASDANDRDVELLRFDDHTASVQRYASLRYFRTVDCMPLLAGFTGEECTSWTSEIMTPIGRTGLGESGQCSVAKDRKS